MKKFFSKNKNISQDGFTIMETLVAIFVLLLAITGPMVFAQNGLRSAFLARDQMTAFFLAQDAIEYIKNFRDGNVVRIVTSSSFSDNEWLDPVGALSIDQCLSSDGCSIDTYRGQIDSCSSTNQEGCVGSELNNYTPLNYYSDGTESYYTTQNINGTTITRSIFSREIKIDKIDHSGNDDIEAQVTVTIRWKSHEGVGVREIVVKENIFNWAHALLN